MCAICLAVLCCEVRQDGLAMRPEAFREEQAWMRDLKGMAEWAAACVNGLVSDLLSLTLSQATKVKWKPKRENWQGSAALEMSRSHKLSELIKLSVFVFVNHSLCYFSIRSRTCEMFAPWISLKSVSAAIWVNCMLVVVLALGCFGALWCSHCLVGIFWCKLNCTLTLLPPKGTPKGRTL